MKHAHVGGATLSAGWDDRPSYQQARLKTSRIFPATALRLPPSGLHGRLQARDGDQTSKKKAELQVD